MSLPAIEDMVALTVADLLADFDAILERVEAGEFFVINDGERRCVLMPYATYVSLDQQS